MTDWCGKCGCHSFALLYGMFCIYISYHTFDIQLSVEGQHRYLHCIAYETKRKVSKSKSNIVQISHMG